MLRQILHSKLLSQRKHIFSTTSSKYFGNKNIEINIDTHGNIDSIIEQAQNIKDKKKMKHIRKKENSPRNVKDRVYDINMKG